MSFTAIAERLLKVRTRRGGGFASYFSGDVSAVESSTADTFAVSASTGRAGVLAATESGSDTLAAFGSSTSQSAGDGTARFINGAGFGVNTPYKKTWLGGKDGFIESRADDASFRNSSPPSEFVFDVADWRIDTARPRSAIRTKTLLWDSTDARNANRFNGTVIYRSGRPELTSAYYHCLYYFTRDSQPYQFKIIRLVAMGPDEGFDGYTDGNGINIYLSNLGNTTGSIALNHTAYRGKYGNGAEFFADVTAPNVSSGGALQPNRWVHLELEFQDSTGDASDGFYSIRMTDAVTGELIGLMEIRNLKLFPSDIPSNRFKYIVLQNYTAVQAATPAPEGANIRVWMQDHMLQVGSRARVKLGNAATHAACTQFEVCDYDPTQWTNSSIRAFPNQGAFPSLAGLYWYVWNANGALVNSVGIPLVIS